MEAVSARTNNEKLVFTYLPGFAKFVRDHHLTELVHERIRIAKEIHFPLLKYIEAIPETELVRMSSESVGELLKYISENRAEEHIELTLRRWRENEFEMIDKTCIAAEDVSLSSYLRKTSLLKFIPAYTNNAGEILAIVAELDKFSAENDKALANTYIEILREQIEQQSEQLVQNEQRLREDITEKQALIEQLRNHDGLYKQAQAMANIGNWIWDLATDKITWTDELFRIYELPKQEISSVGFATSFRHPEDREIVESKVKHVVDTREPVNFTYRIVTKAGNIKTLYSVCEAVKNELGTAYRVIGTVQDVTKQKKAEKLLNEYKDFIEKIANVTPSIIAAYNIHTGQYSYINNGIQKLLGYTPEEILEKGVAFFATIVHPDDLGPLMKKNNAALEEFNKYPSVHSENEPVVEFKYRMRNINGQYRWLHTYGTIFERNEQGAIESVLNVSVDITEQELAEQELFTKNLQLKSSNASLEEYAYMVSHDLKEPLRKISLFGDRLAKTQKQFINEEGNMYLDKITDASLRMQAMIGDLLSVSLISGNKAFENCSLQTILSESLQFLDHKIEESHAVIETDNLPEMHLVPSQFRQLFQNLIGNSLKFTKPDTAPHIKITHRFIPHVNNQLTGLAKARKYLEIIIADNGIGFDNEYAGKIFAIFQRLHTKSEYEGTGIGLSICKKIVENHGGIIAAESAAGSGAKFILTFPIL